MRKLNPTKSCTLELTIAEMGQLLTYVEDRDREGWYYGRKDCFEKRHNVIVEKIRKLLVPTNPS